MQSVLSVIALIAAVIVLLLALVGLVSVLLRAGRLAGRTGASLARALNGPATRTPPPRRRSDTAEPAAQPPADGANGPAA